MHIYHYIKSNNQIKESFVAKHNGGPCLVISRKDTHDTFMWGNTGSITGSTKDKQLCDFTACYNNRLVTIVSHCCNK